MFATLHASCIKLYTYRLSSRRRVVGGGWVNWVLILLLLVLNHIFKKKKKKGQRLQKRQFAQGQAFADKCLPCLTELKCSTSILNTSPFIDGHIACGCFSVGHRNTRASQDVQGQNPAAGCDSQSDHGGQWWSGEVRPDATVHVWRSKSLTMIIIIIALL